MARYKGHDLLLLFLLYHQEERFSSWQTDQLGTKVMISYSSSSCTTKKKRHSGVGSLTRLMARYKGHDLLLLFLLYHQEERFSSRQLDKPHGQVKRSRGSVTGSPSPSPKAR
jgi:hypothetical protein